MRIIHTLYDIQLLRGIFPDDYLNFVEERFRGLTELLDHGETIDTLSLRKHGAMILLEKGDNVRDLSTVGLNPEDGGIFGAIPETAERIELSSISLYQLLIIYNNDYGCFFFSPIGTFDHEVEAWFQEQIS